MNKRNWLRASALACVVVLTGCGSDGGDATAPPPPPPPPTGGDGPTSEKLRLDAFASCSAYADYVADALTKRLLNFGYGGCADTPGGPSLCAVFDAIGAPTPAAPLSTAPISPPASPDQVSQTNVRTAGVDEPDMVKADADGNVYYLERARMHVSDAFPPVALSLTSTTDFPSGGYAHGMLLDEASDLVVVFQNGFEPAVSPTNLAADFAPWYWGDPQVEVLIYDVSDPAAPALQRRHSLQGNFVSARRVGQRVHLVSSNYLTTPSYIHDSLELQQELRDYYAAKSTNDVTAPVLAAAIADRVRALIAQNGTADFLPAARLNRQAGNEMAEPLVRCDQVSRPDLTLDLGLQTITSFDIDGSNLASIGIVNNSYQTYASTDNLYLVQNSRGWFFSDVQPDQAAIYKVAIGAAEPEYRGHGFISGWVNDAFSIDEHDGYLRVATTAGGLTTSNNLYVLEDDTAGRLNVIGSVLGFGPTERIFSARFTGDRGYVVTFRQIDPLFTFDLTTPSDPRLIGELEIPGFSEYMHPIDDAHLLTLGRSGLPSQPLQLQIFDVADLANPVLEHVHVLEMAGGYSYSIAEYDPKAFTYFGPRDLLSIPVSNYFNSWMESFNGFVYFDVDLLAGFSELGRVNHEDLVQERSDCDVAPNVFCIQVWAQAQPLRSVVMTSGDSTFVTTISTHGIKTTSATEPEVELASMPWPD